jgi:superfamily II DNA or RNA helicase
MPFRLTRPMLMAELEREFGDAAIAKAIDIAKDTSKISPLEVSQEPSGLWHARAFVHGADPEPYCAEVKVATVLEKGSFIVNDASCTCPVGHYCKHSAAILLRWVSAWEVTRDGKEYVSAQAISLVNEAASSAAASVATITHDSPKRAPTPTPPPPPEIRHLPVFAPLAEWLRDGPSSAPLPSSASKPAARYEPCVFYVLDELGFLHALRGRRMPGSAGTAELTGERASTQWVRSGRAPPAYAREEDRAILSLAGASNSMSPMATDSIVFLNGAHGSQLLQLAESTGRLVAMTESALSKALDKKSGVEFRKVPPAIQRSPRAAATLRWRVLERGKFTRLQLEVSLAGKPATLLALDPPLALDIAASRLIPVDLAIPAATAAYIGALPPLPKADPQSLAYVRDALAALPGGELLPPLPFENTPVLALPKAILQFAWFEFNYQHGWGRNAHTETATFPAVYVWFDYGGRRVGVNTRDFNTAIEAEVVGTQVRSTLMRNVRVEEAWLAKLPQMLQRAPTVERALMQAYYEGGERFNSLFALPHHDWATHGTAVLAEAQAAGFELDVDPSFPISMQDVPEAELELAPANERGWFRLSLGVTVGKERVDIAPALAKLIGAQADAEAWLAALPTVPTVLLTAKSSNPTKALQGRALVVRLPGERVHAILAPVFDWFRGGAVENMSALQAALNAELPPSAVKYLGRDDKRWIALREAIASGAMPQRVEPAAGFAATLRPYQLHGLNWLENLHTIGMSGVLADDMGLGKTVQTLAFLHRRRRVANEKKPSLIVAPTSVTVNWLAEMRRFTPDLKVLMHHGLSRSLTAKKLEGVDVVVTSYPILQRDEKPLAAFDWDVVVFDEAQSIKNPKAKTYQAAQLLKANMRLALTGTPMENHLGELWALFNLLLPGLLGDLDSFNRIFRHPIEQRSITQQMTKLRERIRPFLLRRTREAVLGDLPEKTEYTRWIELNAQQADLYESLRTAIHEDIRHVIHQKGLKQSTIHILDALLKLRQVCCDPRLVKLPEAQTRFAEAGSAKLDWLMSHIPELLEEGRQILVFSQFTSMLALIAEGLTAQNIVFETLTGDTRDRETPIARFQSGEVRVFLLSLKAGGVGLNLTAADTVIHYDPWWNPAVEAQATARAHRIGQTKPVFVTKLVSQGTLEERMMGLLERKRELAAALLEGEGTALSGITMADVESLLAPINTLQEQQVQT